MRSRSRRIVPTQPFHCPLHNPPLLKHPSRQPKAPVTPTPMNPTNPTITSRSPRRQPITPNPLDSSLSHTYNPQLPSRCHSQQPITSQPLSPVCPTPITPQPQASCQFHTQQTLFQSTSFPPHSRPELTCVPFSHDLIS